VYEESSDEDTKPLEPDDEQDITLPPLTQGEKVRLLEMTPRQHFTDRRRDIRKASLVKILEEKVSAARRPTRPFSPRFRIAST